MKALAIRGKPRLPQGLSPPGGSKPRLNAHKPHHLVPLAIADSDSGVGVAGVFPDDAHRSGVDVDAAVAANLGDEGDEGEEEEDEEGGEEDEGEGGSARGEGRGVARVGEGVGLGRRRHRSGNGATQWCSEGEDEDEG